MINSSSLSDDVYVQLMSHIYSEKLLVQILTREKEKKKMHFIIIIYILNRQTFLIILSWDDMIKNENSEWVSNLLIIKSSEISLFDDMIK